jgi:acyl-CoA thioesterase-1
MRAHVFLLLPLFLAACGGSDAPAPAASPAGPATAAPVKHADAAPVVLCVGTSLTAGLGVDPSEAWPARLQEKIDAAGLRYRVVNAGSSGETSAGARSRIDWLMRQPVAVLILETGANDGLRGQDPAFTRENMQAILDRAKRQPPPPKLVIAGMQALPNYGAEYGKRFAALYPEVAKANDALLVPFILEGVAGVPELNQPDGVHPTPEGHRRMADTVWKVLRPVL